MAIGQRFVLGAFMKRVFGKLAAIGTLLFAPLICAAQQNGGAVFAVSDGHGNIQLLWFPPAQQWPAGGWSVSDTSGNVLIPHVVIGDAAALAALPIEDADTIKRLPDVLGKPQANEKQQQNFINLLGLRAFSDPNFARALGLYATLANVSPGARAYTVQGLDAQGSPTGVKLVSQPVDASQATALPPSPDGVQARVDQTGVSLSWNPPAENRALPAITCVVERNGSSISVKPFVVGTQWNPKLALVVDRSAPPNTTVTYKVYTADAFGRRSQPSSIRIFFPDFGALAPPAVVQAAGSPGKIVVTWTAGQKPNLAGFVVERSFMPDGPWETLMTQALAPGTGQYEDDNLRGGTSYYYRVRAVGPRGDLGPPSFAASAIPTNPGAPPAVTGLAADAGQTRVRLTWTPVSFPVAGYFVERSAAAPSGQGSAGIHKLGSPELGRCSRATVRRLYRHCIRNHARVPRSRSGARQCRRSAEQWGRSHSGGSFVARRAHHHERIRCGRQGGADVCAGCARGADRTVSRFALRQRRRPGRCARRSFAG